ncbi:MAG: molybdenum cofactor biosynthesis protein MoaE [Spirochaetota bacterium]|nr:molybdenum cofactor biosynthesis protein MoaE [Spirochaetota bacterium]
MEIITDKPINLAELLSEAHHEKSGALVLFSGETRNHGDDGRSVNYLEYEAHKSMAETMIKKIVSEAIKKWSLNYAFCVHRIGRVDYCESSVAIITSSAHRKDAYEANKFIIDQIKKDVPIWKKEYFTDGNNDWK